MRRRDFFGEKGLYEQIPQLVQAFDLGNS